MIWAAFLLTHRRGKASPASSVEEFERRMNSLAETHSGSSGRYILMPRKGAKIMDTRERNRFRVRRRRRRIFFFLLEFAVLAALIGLFPPFRKILWAALVLGGLLVLYTLMLLRIRVEEVGQARRRRALESSMAARARADGHRSYRHPPLNGYGGTNGNSSERGSVIRSASVYASGHPSGNGRGNGRTGDRDGQADHPESWVGIAEPTAVKGGGLRIQDDDVHVVVYRSDEIPTDALRSAAP